MRLNNRPELAGQIISTDRYVPYLKSTFRHLSERQVELGAEDLMRIDIKYQLGKSITLNDARKMHTRIYKELRRKNRKEAHIAKSVLKAVGRLIFESFKAAGYPYNAYHSQYKK